MIRLLIITVLIAVVVGVSCRSGGGFAAPLVGSAVIGILATELSRSPSVGRCFVEALALGFLTGTIATLAYWRTIQGRWYFTDGEEVLWLVVYASFSAVAAIAGSTVAFRFKRS